MSVASRHFVSGAEESLLDRSLPLQVILLLQDILPYRLIISLLFCAGRIRAAHLLTSVPDGTSTSSRTYSVDSFAVIQNSQQS